MRIAVISDIHGNCLALEAVLADIEAHAVDMTLNLGDMVSGPLEPGRTADLLIDGDFPTVAGNHERYLVGNAPDGLGPIDRFAHHEMTSEHLDWFAGLPKTLDINGEVFMCHGTPGDPDAPWLDDWFDGRTVTVPDEAAVTAAADGFDYPVLLCGHTHVPRAVRLRDGRLVVNPGSVGLQTIHGSPDARYAILERRGPTWSVSFRVLPYDHESAARQAARHGFPHWTEALATGWPGATGLF
jgi:predicted phosphodiesterase